MYTARASKVSEAKVVGGVCVVLSLSASALDILRQIQVEPGKERGYISQLFTVPDAEDGLALVQGVREANEWVRLLQEKLEPRIESVSLLSEEEK